LAKQSPLKYTHRSSSNFCRGRFPGRLQAESRALLEFVSVVDRRSRGQQNPPEGIGSVLGLCVSRTRGFS
jgi:hypothetical protein